MLELKWKTSPYPSAIQHAAQAAYVHAPVPKCIRVCMQASRSLNTTAHAALVWPSPKTEEAARQLPPDASPVSYRPHVVNDMHSHAKALYVYVYIRIFAPTANTGSPAPLWPSTAQPSSTPHSPTTSRMNDARRHPHGPSGQSFWAASSRQFPSGAVAPSIFVSLRTRAAPLPPFRSRAAPSRTTASIECPCVM
jgi:hypothetical protein